MVGPDGARDVPDESPDPAAFRRDGYVLIFNALSPNRVGLKSGRFGITAAAQQISQSSMRHCD